MSLKQTWIPAVGLGLLLAISSFGAEVPATVTVGNGSLRLGALLQFWGFTDSTALTAKSNFRIRRAELKISGSLSDEIRWFFSVDPAKTPSATGDAKALQDFGIGYLLAPELEFIVGQVKTPTTAEGLEPSSELLFPERTYVARAFGDRREPGAMLAWKSSIWRVNAMISNGDRTNVDDINGAKDVSLRAEVLPFEGGKFGVFTAGGDFGYGAKSRFGANSRVIFSQLLVKGEVVIARNNGIDAHGWAADAAYSFGERFQPAFRYESFVSGASDSSATSVGLNYFLMKQASKIQLAHVWLSDMSGSTGSYTPLAGVSGSLFVASFQAAI